MKRISPKIDIVTKGGQIVFIQKTPFLNDLRKENFVFNSWLYSFHNCLERPISDYRSSVE